MPGLDDGCGSAVHPVRGAPGDTPGHTGSAWARSTAVTCPADPGRMTASRYVTGTHVMSVAHDPLVAPSARLDGSTTHAVARPAVDGLEVSVCGLLVSAVAGTDWHEAHGVPRCGECARVAG